MPKRKVRRGRRIRRNAATSNQGLKALGPVIVRPPANPPVVPDRYFLERTVQWIPSGKPPWSVTPVIVATNLGVNVISLWVREVMVWGPDQGAGGATPIRLVHTPTGLSGEDSGTQGATRSAVGMRLPPHLSGPFQPNAEGVLFQLDTNEPGAVVIQARCAFVTLRSGALEL